MIEHWMVDQITRITTTRNKFGDYVYGNQETINCRFREINDLTRSADGMEELDADALMHVPGSTSIVNGDIICYNGDYYKVTQITNARRGGSTNIEFKKCLLVRHRQVS